MWRQRVVGGSHVLVLWTCAYNQVLIEPQQVATPSEESQVVSISVLPCSLANVVHGTLAGISDNCFPEEQLTTTTGRLACLDKDSHPLGGTSTVKSRYKR